MTPIKTAKSALRKIANHPVKSERKFPLTTIAAFKQLAKNALAEIKEYERSNK